MSESQRGAFVDFSWSTHPVAAIAVGEIAAELREWKLDRPDVMFLFVTRPFAGTLEDIAPALRKLVSPTTLIGCSATQIFSPDGWLVEDPAISVLVVNYGEVEGRRFAPGQSMQPDPERMSVVIAHPDSNHIPAGTTTTGGYSRGPLVLDGDTYMDGAVGVTFPPEADVTSDFPLIGVPPAVLSFADTDLPENDPEITPIVSGFVSSSSFTDDLTVFGAKSASSTW